MNVSKTNEKAFEASIQRSLTGKAREDWEAEGLTVEEAAQSYGDTRGESWGYSFSRDYEAKTCIDKVQLLAFLEETQAEELKRLKEEPEWEASLLQRLSRKVKKEGVLHVLRKGLKHNGAALTLLYHPPTHSLSTTMKEKWEKNRFTVTRQLYFSEKNPHQSLDMVLLINGLPIVTMELKNPWTGQTVVHARKQYKEDRDPREPLFAHGRCVVHFALDTEEVYMTTKLAGKKTFFLPFNKGNEGGAGNPTNPEGHKTAYLWEEVLQKESLVNLLLHYAMMVEEEKEKKSKTRTLYFPRYHQMEVVRSLLGAVKEGGVGERYLIQHSAGSGKSNSMTWLAYQLIELPDPSPERERMFDSVIVVTDRRLLNRQLRDNIRQFSQVSSIVAQVQHSRDLRKALEEKKKIIPTTIQKFPFVVETVSKLSSHRFAVIIDEAHSSQGGINAAKLNMALVAEGEEELSVQEMINKYVQDRKMSPNASFFAFTATPKNSTLERFGTLQRKVVAGKEVLDLVEGKKQYRPFHEYTMKQAIEEGFILDVTANYTTYRSYYELQKSIAENPRFQTTKAQKKLRSYVEGHRETIKVKAEIIVQHFLKQVVTPRRLKGQGKGMVVTRSIENAILYFHAIREALKVANVPFKAVVAFSGKKSIQEQEIGNVRVKGAEYTEESLNGFPSSEIKTKFDTEEYRLLVVANKFLTGFDQPKLCTMYVDKKLQDVLAVQALSRLNRCAPSLGKRTEDVMVLDFFNQSKDIKSAFDRYYTTLTLEGSTDPNVLYDLRDEILDTDLCEEDDIEEFNELFFKGVEGSELSTLLDSCAQRFKEWEDEEQADLKIKAKQFVKLYSQIAPLLSFDSIEWEKTYWFLKFLIPKLTLKKSESCEIKDLLDSVDLSTYALERVHLNQNIGLDASEGAVAPPNSNPRGTHTPDEEKDFLDEIIETFNQRWFSGWDATPEEQKIKFMNLAQHVIENPNFDSLVLNNPDQQNRSLALDELISEAVLKERRKEMNLYLQYRNDDDFKVGLHSVVEKIVLESSEAIVQKLLDNVS